MFLPKLGIAPRVNQLSIHPDAIADPACRALKNMCYAQCQSDFTQIARAALELLYRGAADDLKVSDLGQIRENVIVYAGREVFVLSVVTQIFERKNSDAFFRNIADCGGADRQRGQTSVAFLGAPDSRGVRSNIHDSVSAIGKPSTDTSTIRRTAQFGISKNGKTCVAI